MKGAGSILSILLLLLVQTEISAQQLRLRIYGLEGSRINLPRSEQESWTTAREQVAALQQGLFLEGYLANGIDSQKIDSIHWDIWWHLGERYRWASLSPGNADEELLRRAGYEPRQWQKSTFDPEALIRLQQKLVQAYAMQGYPFATVSLQLLGGTPEAINAALYVDPYQLFTIDTVLWGTDLKVNSAYLRRYTGLSPGKPYQEPVARQADQLLKQLPFVQWNAPSQVSFQGNKAVITHYISGKKVSYFDGIVGMAPNSPNNADRFLLTGEANLQLQNLGGTGAFVSAQWKSFLKNSQDLKAAGQYPYLFGTRLGLAPAFSFLRLDTIYSTLQWEMGLPYLFTGNNQLKVFYQQANTRLITADTQQVRRTRSLPGFNDMVQRAYGMGWQRQNLDQLLIPRKGYKFSMELAVGSRRIVRNNQVEQVQFEENGQQFSVYDVNDSLFFQWRGGWKGEYYLSLHRRHILQIYAQGSFLFTDRILENELYRIGGIRDLRGFDEQSIWCSQYYLSRLEYRFLLDKSAFVQVFVNAAWTERKTVSTYTNDWPYGIGAGFSFLSGPGLFTLNYALGSQQGNPLVFRAAKIHFGFISYF